MFFNKKLRLREVVLVLTLFGLALAPPPTRAESTDAALVRSAAQSLAAGLGHQDSRVLAPGKVSMDLLFLFQELQGLEQSLSSQSAVCPYLALTIEALGDPNCLAALLVAERKTWRLAAELAAQSHQLASRQLALRIPVPVIPVDERTDERLAEMETWWRKAAPTGLEAVARIGREWMKKKSGEERQRDLRRMARALRQIEREPAIAQLRSGLARTEEFRPLSDLLGTIVNSEAELEDRAEAALSFAAAYADLQARELEEIIDEGLTGEACVKALPDAFREILQADLAICNAGAERLKTTVASLTEASGNGVFGELAGKIAERAGAVEAYTSALTEAFEERQLTFRLLLAKLNAVPADVASCSDAAQAMAEQENTRFKGDLDADKLEETSRRTARVVKLCTRQAGVNQLVLLCQSVLNAAQGPGERLAKALAAAPQSLSEEARNRLEAPWQRFLEAAGPDQAIRICSDKRQDVLESWSQAAAQLSGETKSALEGVVAEAVTALETKAIREIRTTLDRLELPIEVSTGFQEAVAGLCRLTEQGADGKDKVSRQLTDAILADMGLLTDGQRAVELEPLCTQARKGHLFNANGAFSSELLQSLGQDEDARKAAVDRLTAALQALKDKGAMLAERVTTAAVVMEGARVLDEIATVSDKKSHCGTERHSGLTLGLKASGVEREFVRHDDGWQINIRSKVAVVLCGQRPRSPEDLQQIVTAASVSADAFGTFDLSKRYQPEDVSKALQQAMREAYRNAEVTIDEDLLRDKLRQVAQAAEIDLRGYTALSFGEPEANGFDPEHGLVLRFALPDPVNESICLSVPITILAEGCHPFEEAGTVLDQLLQTLAAKALERVIEEAGPVLEDLAQRLAEVETLKAELKRHAEVGVVRTHVGGQVRPTLRIKLPEATLKLLTRDTALPELRGDLIVEIRKDDGRLLLDFQQKPTIDTKNILLTQLKNLPRSFIVLTEAGTPEEPPGDLSFSGVDRNHCENAYVYLAAFGPQAPLQGKLGHICFRSDERTPWLVINVRDGLSTPDGNWQITFRDLPKRGREGVYDITARITSQDPMFGDIRRMRVLLRADLSKTEFLLPADAEENAEFYAAIERALSDRLPRGVRVHGLQFSSDGIKISIDPSGAGEAAWRLLETMALEEAGPWVAWFEEVGARISENAAEFCETVGPYYQLGKILAEGRVAEGCPQFDPPTEGTVSVRGGAVIDWECRARQWQRTSDGKLTGPVDDCTVSIPRELMLCGEPVDLLFSWPNGPGQPELKSRDLEACLSRELEALLPDDLHPYKAPVFSFEAGCLNLDDVSDCGVRAELELDLSDLAKELSGAGTDLMSGLGRAEESCAISGSTVTVTGLATLDGMVRFEMGETGIEPARDRFKACADALAEAAMSAAFHRVVDELEGRVDLDGLYDELASAGGRTLEAVRSQVAVSLTGAANCRLRGRNANCADLNGSDIRTGRVTGADLSAPVEMLGQQLELSAVYDWDTRGVDLKGILPNDLDGWISDKWNRWVDQRGARFAVRCLGTTNLRCLDDIANRLARTLSNDVLTYDEGASLSIVGGVVTLVLPFTAQLDILGVSAAVRVTCTLDMNRFPEIAASHCGESGFNPEDALMASLAKALADKGVLSAGEKFDLGILTLEVSDPPKFLPNIRQIELTANASFANIGLAGDEALPARVTLDHNLRPHVDVNVEELVGKASQQLTSALNGLLGDYGIKIEKVTPRIEGTVPKALVIQSIAIIGGLFSLSVPRVELSENGLKLLDPNKFGISFPEGLTIPVTPFAICPNGGAIEDTELTIYAGVTVGECTASYLVNYRGSVTLDIKTPLKVNTEGTLTLLSIIPLGHNKGEMDLGKPYVSHEAEIGGAVSDVIFMRSTFEMDGKTLQVDADGNIKIFKVPVGEGHFGLSLKEGLLDTSLNVDLGFVKGNGAMQTQRGFSRPKAVAVATMSVAGFDWLDTDILARSNFAKARVSVFGLKLGVAFPGLDALDPDKIAELLKKLLTPNFANLDEALEALLSGNVTINPFADFGSGGDGMGGDGDGDAGESGEGNPGGDGQNSPGEGMGADAGAPAPGPGTPIAQAPGGEPGHLGTQRVELFFQPLSGTDPSLVQIGTGTRGTPEERKVAVARITSGHFADDGKALGQTLVVLPGGYSQLVQAPIQEGGGCPASDGQVAYLYSGETVARRGYYESCRILDLAGQPLASLTGINDSEAKRDLASFHDALIAEMETREEEPDGDYGRLLLRGRIVDATANHGLRGVIGFQRVGEVLGVMRGRLSSDGSCGTVAVPDESAELKTKIFWLTGTRETDLEEPKQVLDAVQALWNCEDGTLGRIDPKDKTLATADMVSKASPDGSGFQRIARIEPPKDITVTPPNWVGNRNLQAVPFAAEKIDPEPKLPSITECGSDCGTGVQVDFLQAGDGCEILVDGIVSGKYRIGELGAGCTPSENIAFIVANIGEHVQLYKAEEGERARLAVTNLKGFGQSSEAFAIGKGHRLTPVQSEMIRGFLRTFGGAEDPATLSEARLLVDPAGRQALEGAHPEGGRFWSLSSTSEAWTIRQSGETLPEDRATAAVAILTSDVADADLLDADRLFLRRPDEVWLYRWVGTSWQAIATIVQMPGTENQEREVALELFDTIAEAPEQPHIVRIVAYDRNVEAWAYAISDGNGQPGRLVMRRAVVPENVLVSDPEGRLNSAQDKVDLPATGKASNWIELDLSDGGPDWIELWLTKLDEGDDFDPYLCVFDASGSLIASNDDVLVDDVTIYYSRLALRRIPGKNKYFLEVKNYNGNVAPSVKTHFALRESVEETNSYPGCSTPEMMERVPYFDTDPEVVEIAGLSLALDDRARLLALTGKLLGNPPDKSLVLFESTAVAKYQPKVFYLAEGDAQSLTFSRFTGQGRPVLAIEEMATFSEAVPPGHAWGALAKDLDGTGATVQAIEGANMDLSGLEAEAGWAVVLPGIHGEGQRVYFRLKGKTRSVDMGGRFEDKRVVAAAVSYLLATEASHLRLVRNTPPLAVVDPVHCAPDPAPCRQELVQLRLEEGEVSKVPIAHRKAGKLAFETVLSIFARLAEEAPDQLNDTVLRSNPWEQPLLRPVRLTKGSVVHVIADDGAWGCLDASNLPLDAAQIAKALSLWPADALRGFDAPGFCSDRGVDIWRLAADLHSGEKGLLYASGDQTPLDIIPLSDGGERIGTDFVVPDSLKALLVDSLKGLVSAETSLSIVATPANGLYVRDLLIYEVADRSTGTHSWVAGFRVQLPDQPLIACVMGAISADMPEGVPDDLRKELVDEIVKQVDRDDLTTCPRAERRRLNIIHINDTWEVWVEHLDRADLELEHLPGFRRVQLAQAGSGGFELAFNAQETIPVRQWRRWGSKSTLTLDERFFPQDEVIARQRRDTVQKAVAALEYSLRHPTEITKDSGANVVLHCFDDCSRLHGTWGARDGLVLIMPVKSDSARIVHLRNAADYGYFVDGFAAALAQAHMPHCLGEICAASFDLKMFGGAVSAAEAPVGQVYVRRAGSLDVVPVGKLQRTQSGQNIPPDADTDLYETAMRNVLLSRIAEGARPFQVIPLRDGVSWNGGVAPVLLAFPQTGQPLQEWAVIWANGERGPVYWTASDTVPSEAQKQRIRDHLTFLNRPGAASDAAFWVSIAAQDRPVLFELAGSPKSGTLPIKARLGSDNEADVLFPDVCRLPLTVSGSAANGFGMFSDRVHAIACLEEGDMLVALGKDEPETVVLSPVHAVHALLDISASESSSLGTLISVLALPAIHNQIDRLKIFDRGITVYMVVEAENETRAAWRLAGGGDLELLGAFSGLDSKNDAHRALLAALPPSGSLNPRGQFFQFARDQGPKWEAVVFEGSKLLVTGAREQVHLARLLDPSWSPAPTEPLFGLYLENLEARADDPDESLLFPLDDDALIALEREGDILVRANVVDRSQLHELDTQTTWPDGIPAEAAQWYASLLRPPILAGAEVHSVQRHTASGTVGVCSNDGGTLGLRLDVVLEGTDPNRYRLLRLEEKSCAALHKQMDSLVLLTNEQRIMSQNTVLFRPAQRSGGRDIVLTGATTVAADTLWSLEGGTRQLCRADLPWRANVLERLVNWLSESGTGCDYASVSNDGRFAMAKAEGAGLPTILWSSGSRQIDLRSPSAQAAALRPLLLGWFSSFAPRAGCGAPLQVVESGGGGQILLDDPCGSVAKQEGGAFRALAERADATSQALPINLLDQLAATVASADPGKPARFDLSFPEARGVDWVAISDRSQAGAGADWIVLTGENCVWVSLMTSKAMTGAAAFAEVEKLGSLLKANQGATHIVLLPLVLSTGSSIVIAATRQNAACDQTEMTQLPGSWNGQWGEDSWDLRASRVDEAAWYPLLLGSELENVLGKLGTDRVLADFVSHQLQDGVKTARHWKGEDGGPARYLVDFGTGGVCFKLVAQEKGERLTTAELKAVMNTISQTEETDQAWVDYLIAAMDRYNLSKRWYQTLSTDPRGKLHFASHHSC